MADERAPVLVGVGETSGKALGVEWPSTAELAGAAVKAALSDSGAAEKLAASIDCLLSTRLFHDSGLPHDFGSPENHPEAVATASGSGTLKHCSTAMLEARVRKNISINWLVRCMMEDTRR